MLPEITVRVRGHYHDRDGTTVTIQRSDSDEVEFVELADSLKYRNHSPDGFSWGYAGSGPSQLAFAILQRAVGVEFAEHHYQQFKFDVIVAVPQDAAGWDAVIDLAEWQRSGTEQRAFAPDLTLYEAAGE
jgi:hypothetical protein